MNISTDKINIIINKNDKDLSEFLNVIYGNEVNETLDYLIKLKKATELKLITIDDVNFYKKYMIQTGKFDKTNEFFKKKEICDTTVFQDCLICYDKHNKDEMVSCKSNHFFCKDCFEENIKNFCINDDLTNQEKVIKFDRKCCSHNCKECFSEDEILKFIKNDQLKKKWLDTIKFLNERKIKIRETNDTLKKICKSFQDAETERIRQKLKNEMVGAKQCQKCNFGPILQKGCDNLRTHAMEAHNSCPRCGFQFVSWKNLKQWDGRLPNETNTESKIGSHGKKIKIAFFDNFYTRYDLQYKEMIITLNKYTKFEILKTSNRKILIVKRKEMVLWDPNNLYNPKFRTDELHIDISEKTPFVKKRNALRHIGSWSGCGGNYNGYSVTKETGNCTSECRNCGANKNWTCCGSNDKNSAFCIAGMTLEIARKNVAACRLVNKNIDFSKNITKNLNYNFIARNNLFDKDECTRWIKNNTPKVYEPSLLDLRLQRIEEEEISIPDLSSKILEIEFNEDEEIHILNKNKEKYLLIDNKNKIIIGENNILKYTDSKNICPKFDIAFTNRLANQTPDLKKIRPVLIESETTWDNFIKSVSRRLFFNEFKKNKFRTEIAHIYRKNKNSRNEDYWINVGSLNPFNYSTSIVNYKKNDIIVCFDEFTKPGVVSKATKIKKAKDKLKQSQDELEKLGVKIKPNITQNKNMMNGSSSSNPIILTDTIKESIDPKYILKEHYSDKEIFNFFSEIKIFGHKKYRKEILKKYLEGYVFHSHIVHFINFVKRCLFLKSVSPNDFMFKSTSLPLLQKYCRIFDIFRHGNKSNYIDDLCNLIILNINSLPKIKKRKVETKEIVINESSKKQKVITKKELNNPFLII